MSGNKTRTTRIIRSTTWFRTSTKLPPTVMADRPKRVVAWLLFKHSSRKFKLSRVNTLGRDHRCEITISDEMVSAEHAKIKFENTQFTLYDIASTNGTYLNGKRISTPELLADGDVIQLGNTELVFKRT